MNEIIIKDLIKKSLEAKKRAYCVYSHYPVGAALLTKDDKVYTGCNIEVVSFSPTICAERNAIFKAVSEGVKEFKSIAITAGDGSSYPSPCGVCRQVMREFCSPKDFVIILAKNEDEYKLYTLEELLPDSFGPESL